MTVELIAKANRLLELRKKLSRYQAELKELRDLEGQFSPESLALIEAFSGNGTNGKAKRTVPMEPSDANLWAKIKGKFPKGKEAKLDAKQRLALAEEHALTVGVVNGTIAEHCTGSFSGPNAGRFTLKN